jgi:hypothetical protein
VVEPHKLKPTAAPHAFKDIILLSISRYTPKELRGIPTSYSPMVLKPCPHEEVHYGT